MKTKVVPVCEVLVYSESASGKLHVPNWVILSGIRDVDVYALFH